jgi:hypothetical protein
LILPVARQQVHSPLDFPNKASIFVRERLLLLLSEIYFRYNLCNIVDLFYRVDFVFPIDEVVPNSSQPRHLQTFAA